MILAVAVTSKDKLITGIKIGYKFIPPPPQSLKITAKNTWFSWESLFL